MASNQAIVAITSGTQRSAVSIIRISGQQLTPFLDLFGQPRPRVAHYRCVFDSQGEPLDNGIVLYFPAPHSYTGEDVIEFQGHGSPIVMRQLVDFFCTLGARPAREGEFSKRAFLNGKIDLAQAEAVADLIEAQSIAASRAALKALSGAFSNRVHAIESALRQLRGLVEGAIDFSDEEIEFIEADQLSAALVEQNRALDDLLRGAQTGQYLRDGINIAIIGAPNVGKSTLLNTLVGRDRAITSTIAGTTRDVIDADFEIDGIAVTLMDTAGIHHSEDPIERLGIERSQQVAQAADVILSIATADTDFVEIDESPTPIIKIINKIDALPSNTGGVIAISALQNTGINALKRAILKSLNIEQDVAYQFTARSRHIDAIRQSQQHLSAAVANQHHELGVELVAEEIRLAHDVLGEITGSVHSDDILGDIFSSFCIGK